MCGNGGLSGIGGLGGLGELNLLCGLSVFGGLGDLGGFGCLGVASGVGDLGAEKQKVVEAVCANFLHQRNFFWFRMRFIVFLHGFMHLLG